ncbi:MAG TPA: hypothetical protein DDW17_09930 [Deltaproteobacteria bacterium]|nr:hypothetical protein [Deltaproteobacteria bacterium]
MWFEIFKAGTFTDSEGVTRTWTEEDLDTIVSRYDPSQHEAPIVIGHPKDNSPAWGWIEAIKREGGKLLAKAKDMVPEFKEMVNKGLFKKRSISLYPDLTLRHVGFLGATPPAVKGLADVQFSDDKAASIEFDEYQMNILGNIFQRLREWFIEKFGIETADRVVGTWDIDELKRPQPSEASAFAEGDREKAKKAQEARAKKYGIAVKEGGNVTKPSEYESILDDEFADPVNYRYPIDESHVQAALSYWGMPKNREQYTAEEVKTITQRILKAAKKAGIEIDEDKWNFIEKEEDMDKIVELEAKIKQLEQSISNYAEKDKAKDRLLADLKQELEKERAEKRKAEFNAFCDGLVSEGKLTPAQKVLAVDFMEILSGVAEYEFAEGDAKVKKAPLEAFKSLLTTLPKQVEFSEHATKGRASGESGKDKVREQKVSEYMEKNKGASYKDAVIAVSRENPELFREEA